MADLMAIAKSLESIANAQANVDDELEMREAEREEHKKSMLKQTHALQAVRGQFVGGTRVELRGLLDRCDHSADAFGRSQRSLAAVVDAGARLFDHRLGIEL